MSDLAIIYAGGCCLGIWAVVGGSAGWLAHRRMRSVERYLGVRAEPANESRYLWYAGAAHLWLAAAALALVGLSSGRWARSGRDATFIFLAHFTFVTFGAIAIGPSAQGPLVRNMVPIITVACIVVGLGFTAAIVLGFLWASARARRIEALPRMGPPPGAERFAIYIGSFLLWPIGMVAAGAYRQPQNVRVGATALRLSLTGMGIFVVVASVAIPILLARYGPVG